MTERDIRDYLQDILSTIEMAEQFVNGMTFEQFQDDPKTIFAVTRALEVIKEPQTKVVGVVVNAV